ncbi:ATP-binding protein [Streptomyces sp. Vc74B-19]|uniref:ATP-binding protein n=1 Tax=Streptomyces sp. Vc74B-19 TaxID=2741324 RepID=UPI0027E2F0FA|nr:ATP-binding protein [Streptomyces sp. Vc74B-19]
MDELPHIPLWHCQFLAEPEEVARLRATVRARLHGWVAQEGIDSAQLCVSELVSNVITHLGRGTPTSLTLSLNGARLRIEVRDPDTRVLPTLVEATGDAESGRGMTLIDALSDRWGVELRQDGKVTWCEILTASVTPQGGGARSPRLARAARILSSYSDGKPSSGPRRSRIGALATEAAAIDLISDLLYWLRVHGHDADDILDRAQTHFEAELGAASGPG